MNVSEKTYKYRNLPCTVGGGQFFVSGQDKNGSSGILEWCRSADDVQFRLELMSEYPQFEGLQANTEGCPSTGFAPGIIL